MALTTPPPVRSLYNNRPGALEILGTLLDKLRSNNVTLVELRADEEFPAASFEVDLARFPRIKKLFRCVSDGIFRYKLVRGCVLVFSFVRHEFTFPNAVRTLEVLKLLGETKHELCSDYNDFLGVPDSQLIEFNADKFDPQAAIKKILESKTAASGDTIYLCLFHNRLVWNWSQKADAPAMAIDVVGITAGVKRQAVATPSGVSWL